MKTFLLLAALPILLSPELQASEPSGVATITLGGPHTGPVAPPAEPECRDASAFVVACTDERARTMEFNTVATLSEAPDSHQVSVGLIVGGVAAQGSFAKSETGVAGDNSRGISGGLRLQVDRLNVDFELDLRGAGTGFEARSGWVIFPMGSHSGIRTFGGYSQLFRYDFIDEAERRLLGGVELDVQNRRVGFAVAGGASYWVNRGDAIHTGSGDVLPVDGVSRFGLRVDAKLTIALFGGNPRNRK